MINGPVNGGCAEHFRRTQATAHVEPGARRLQFQRLEPVEQRGRHGSGSETQPVNVFEHQRVEVVVLLESVGEHRVTHWSAGKPGGLHLAHVTQGLIELTGNRSAGIEVHTAAVGNLTVEARDAGAGVTPRHPVEHPGTLPLPR